VIDWRQSRRRRRGSELNCVFTWRPSIRVQIRKVEWICSADLVGGEALSIGKCTSTPTSLSLSSIRTNSGDRCPICLE
jgi:hypothetical protein